MNEPSAPDGTAAAGGAGNESVRVRLARLAHTAAMTVEGVADTHSGPLGVWVTSARGERISGVVSTILPGGSYALELHLTTHLVPLHPLADDVRRRVAAAARTAGLSDSLGPIDIAIEDLAGSEADPAFSAAPPPAPSPTAPGPEGSAP